MSYDARISASPAAEPGTPDFSRLVRLIDATQTPLQSIHAAARLLESPFVWDQQALVKQIQDNATLLEEYLATIRSCLAQDG
jgi:hypothetical protein